MLRQAPFQIKWQKSDLNIWVGSFLTHAAAPHWKAFVGFRIGAPGVLRDVNTNFDFF